MPLFKLKPPRFYIRDTHPELPLDPDVERPGIYKWPPHFTPSLVSLVFLGGCFGTIARYWVVLRLPDTGSGWPVSTLTVNLLGAFLLGLLLEGLARLGTDEGARRAVRLAIGTGFMGGFTTYSTFSVDTDLLLRGHHVSLALWYVGMTIFGGLLLSAAGIRIAAVHHHKRKERGR